MESDNSKNEGTPHLPESTTPPPQLENMGTKDAKKDNENIKKKSCLKPSSNSSAASSASQRFRTRSIFVPRLSPDNENDSTSINDTVPATKRPRQNTPGHSSIRFELPPFQRTKLYQSFNDDKYFDLVLVSSDQIEIPTYRCIFASHSQKFSRMFEKIRVHPARIQVKDFDAATIKYVIDFMFEKLNSVFGKEVSLIKFAAAYVFGKEVSLIKFAAAYGIQDLMEKCCASVQTVSENYLSSSNVNLCDYIEIAYAHDLHGLKDKCLKLLALKKKEMDVNTLKKLDKNILIDIMRY
uniref:BTB domain-containing protein n=1 Tax=Panagrolaimus sp. ES5 TaxID=591445 RepID=A0AC34GA37_9BILA